jgi:hypothetical protein
MQSIRYRGKLTGVFFVVQTERDSLDSESILILHHLLDFDFSLLSISISSTEAKGTVFVGVEDCSAG